MKLISSINKENLNQNEINEINNLCSINKLCKKIMEKYISYLIFNSKINNIYIYKRELLLFMGEQFLFLPFSLKSKKFLGIESGNLIKTNSNNFNNFKIIKITCDKIIINDEGKKNVKIIEVDNNGNSNTYNFYLVKNSFNYHTNAIADKKYLLFDNIKNNNLNFSLVNLDNYSIENNYYDFCLLLNFKIDNNPPKIYLTQNFSKFIYLYENNNQVSVIDFSLNKKLQQNENNIINLKYSLQRDNDIEIIPEIYKYSSYYKSDFKPEKLLNKNKEEYYCVKANKGEYIQFKFSKEYCFCLIDITFTNSYEKSKLKKLKINVYDINETFLRSYIFTFDSSEKRKEIINMNDKGAFLKFDFFRKFWR